VNSLIHTRFKDLERGKAEARFYAVAAEKLDPESWDQVLGGGLFVTEPAIERIRQRSRVYHQQAIALL
jgi:hypothetical protein